MKYFFSFLVFPDSTIKNGFDWYPNWQRWIYCSFSAGGNFVLSSEQQQLLPYYHEHASSVAVMINQENMLHFFL